jgi:hypothetical protein
MPTTESSLRRSAARHGLALHKSRKPFGLDNHGHFMVVDTNTSAVIAGERFDMTFTDVADLLSSIE